VKRGYAPEAGDLVWLDFDPQAGREQAGRRPALVLSHAQYNRRVGLAVMCPVTSRQKGYPFEVALPLGLPVSGFVLADQLKNLDWQHRRAELAGHAPAELLDEVRAKIAPLIGL
jgi:mRNA interferase MazF